MSRGFAWADRRTETPQEDSPPEKNAAFSLDESHERRILSWFLDPEEDFGPDLEPDFEPEPDTTPVLELQAPPASRPVEPRPEPPRAQVAPAEPVRLQPVQPAPPQPIRLEPAPPRLAPVEAPPVEPVVVPTAAPPQPAVVAETESTLTYAQEPKRRGRPRGRPRRQVHFHVDPDEELLLLAAARLHGSQQKGLVAALQALQDNEVLREEIEKLRTECERQRVLLADAEALFRR